MKRDIPLISWLLTHIVLRIQLLVQLYKFVQLHLQGRALKVYTLWGSFDEKQFFPLPSVFPKLVYWHFFDFLEELVVVVVIKQQIPATTFK